MNDYFLRILSKQWQQEILREVQMNQYAKLKHRRRSSFIKENMFEKDCCELNQPLLPGTNHSLTLMINMVNEV